MKVNDKDCNFTSTFKAKVTLSRQEWLDKTNEIISAVLMQVAGGSPLKTYDTKEDLDLAEPPSGAPENGYTGTRLVKTDADGKAHWYYFKSDLKQWLDGGIYVAVNLEEYCKTNGFYALLGAGYAAQLLSPKGNVISKDTFISRETYNGSSFGEGAAVLRKIEGNTQKCYQLWNEEWDVGSISNVDGVPHDLGEDLIRSKNMITASANQQYCINSNKVVTSTGPLRFNIFFYRKDLSYISYLYNVNTFTTPDETAYFKFVTNYDKYGRVYQNDIMLNSGTEPKPYEPYYSGLRSAKPTRLVSTGKNLFNKNLPPQEIAVNILGAKRWGYKFALPKGTYSVTCTPISDKILFIKTLINGVYGSAAQLINFYRITLKEKGYIILYTETRLNFDSYNDIMLYKGSESKPFEEYKESVIEIAPEIQALEGYGEGFNDKINVVDLINNKFIQKVKKVDLSKANWTWDPPFSGDKGYFKTLTYKDEIYFDKDVNLTPANIICSKYPVAASNDFNNQSFAIGVHYSFGTEPPLIDVKIIDDSFNGDLEAFKKSLVGVELAFPIREEKVIDLPVVQDDKFVAYNNGTETWEGTQVPVPTEIGYLPDLINKLWDLLTAAQQKAIDDNQDESISNLNKQIPPINENVSNLTNRVTELEKIKDAIKIGTADFVNLKGTVTTLPKFGEKCSIIDSRSGVPIFFICEGTYGDGAVFGTLNTFYDNSSYLIAINQQSKYSLTKIIKFNALTD